MKLEITPADVEGATVDCNDCPTARALKREFLVEANVGVKHAELCYTHYIQNVKLSEDLASMIIQFLHDGDFTPGLYDIELL